MKKDLQHAWTIVNAYLQILPIGHHITEDLMMARYHIECALATAPEDKERDNEQCKD